MLRLSDLEPMEWEESSRCYLWHPARSDDSDDALIDVANQLEVHKLDLVQWARSGRSWHFMELREGSDLDISDFLSEFEPFRGDSYG